MTTLIENSRKAAEVAKQEIAKIKEWLNPTDSEFYLADDAYLGADWAIKKLDDLEAALQDRS